MAVLIKGMEMPKACDSCRFLDDSGDYNICWATSESVGYTFPVREKRMPHCPIVEAKEPKPHESRAKLPCPKCGRKPKWSCYSGKSRLVCFDCEIAGEYSKTEIGAIRDWNKVVSEWTE